MVLLKQRNDPVRLLWRRLALLVLIVLIFYAVWAVWGVFWKARESASMRAQAESQLGDLEARKARLTIAIANLETDRGREEVLREQYAVGKEGEGMIQIIDPDPPPQPTTTPKTWIDNAFSWW